MRQPPKRFQKMGGGHTRKYVVQGVCANGETHAVAVFTYAIDAEAFSLVCYAAQIEAPVPSDKLPANSDAYRRAVQTWRGKHPLGRTANPRHDHFEVHPAPLMIGY